MARPGHHAWPAAGRSHLHLRLGVTGARSHALRGAALAATGSCQTGRGRLARLMPASWLPPGRHGGGWRPCPRCLRPAGPGGMPAAGIRRIQRLISWQRSFRSNRRAAEGSGRAAAREEEEREALAEPPGTCGSGRAAAVAGCWTAPAGILWPAPGVLGQQGARGSCCAGGAARPAGVWGGWERGAACAGGAGSQPSLGQGRAGGRRGWRALLLVLPKRAHGLASPPRGAGTGLVELPPRTSRPQLCQGQIAHCTDWWRRCLAPAGSPPAAPWHRQAVPTDQLFQQLAKPKPHCVEAPHLVLAKARPFRAGPPQPLAHTVFSVACESQSECLHYLPLPLFLFFTASLF